MANRFLSNIRINDAYTLPASDGSSGQVITTDGSGNLSFVDPTSGAATTALSLNVTVKNVSGGSLSKGTIVHAHPSANPPSGNVIEVIAADYDDTTKMPAIGVLNETLANEAEGQAIMFGAVSGIDTSGFSIGDELWVGNNGAFTNTKPATAGQLIQKIAVVIKSHATAGLIKVFGAGRTNDVPLPLYIDNTNQRVGIGISTPAVPLHVNGWARLNGSLQLDGSNRQVMAIDNTSLLFGTDNTVRMTITNVGKVGIALTSPESKLDVFESSTNQKAFKATDGTSWVSFVPTLGSGGYNGISSAGDIGLIFSIDNDNTTNSTTNGLVIAPHAQATSGLKILENGYVGIGDSTPLYSLHVESTDDTLALFKSTDNKASIRVADDDTSAYVSAENGRASFGHYIGANSNNLNINSSGNVSIGTTSASDKLTVAGDVNVSGALKGPSTFYIDPSPDDTGEPGGATTDTGTVVILGDLQVTGTTTTIDSTTLNIGDLNIVLAKDATTAAAANGAGITINGANATMTYDSTNDRFNFNKAIASSTHVTSGANVYSGTSGQFRNYAGVWTATTGVSGNGFSFISADGTAMTISSTGDISASGATFDSNVNIRKNNVGIITTYSSASIEATDAQLDIISSASGTWGSSINLVEGASSTANTNVWSIARQTSGVGNLLRFNFGTVNQHDNAQMFSISTGGNATAQGSVSATVFYDVTNTAYYVNPDNTGTSANFAGKVQASQVGVTNIVTNKVVKFNGSILDDSIITDDGTFIDVAGKVQADNAFVVQGIDTSNSQPSSNHAFFSGYGIVGNRGTFYVTNAGTVQIGNGVNHNNNPTALFTSSSISLLRPTVISGSLEADGSFKLDDVHIRGIGAIGLNRDTSNGNIYDSNYSAFQLQHNRSIDAFELQAYNSSGTFQDRFVFTNTGKFGIGTTAPNYKLEVYDGDVGARDLYLKSITNSNVRVQGVTTGDLDIYNNSTHRAKFSSTGDFWLYGNNNIKFSATGDATIGNYSGTGTLSFRTAAVQRMLIDSSGNVGVGLTSPIYTLDVNGTLGVRAGTIQTNGSTASFNFLAGSAAKGAKVGFLLASNSYSTTPASGVIEAQTDMRAPIYYDANNTNRYVNPSDAGRSIHVEGYITAGIGDSKGFEIGAGGAHITAVGLGDVVFQGAGQLRFGPSNWDWNQWGGIKYTGGASPILYIGGPASSVFSSNSAPPSTEINFTGTTFVISDTSFRAPIFYDSNDTSYYVHPDNLSHLNIVRVPGDIRGNGQQLILNAGESAAYATGQTGENVYVNAENGLQVNSSPDNWGSGWAGRYTATICDAAGNSYFPGRVQAGEIYTAGKVIHTGDTDTYTEFNAADTWRVVVGGSQKLVVNSSSVSVSNATLSHQGVTLSSGDNIDQIHTFAMSFTLTALTWTDTGISHTDLPTGTYTVQVYVDDHNAGGQHYDEYYSGTMSWYAGSTNSTNSDEIVLHNAGHASGSSYIQLRTERHTNTTGTHLMLQVKQNFNHSTALDGTDGKTMTFKFRRLL